jgi:hypothetical protein
MPLPTGFSIRSAFLMSLRHVPRSTLRCAAPTFSATATLRSDKSEVEPMVEEHIHLCGHTGPVHNGRTVTNGTRSDPATVMTSALNE